MKKLAHITLVSALFWVTSTSTLVNTVKADDINDVTTQTTVQDTESITTPAFDNVNIPYSPNTIFASKASSAPLVRIAPDPSGSWHKMNTKKWKANKAKDLESGFLGFLGYAYVSPITSILIPMVSNHINGYPVWLTGSGYYKSGKYVNLYKMTVTIYKNSSRTKKLSSSTYKGRIVKQTTFARRKTIKPSESPMSSFTY